MGAKLRAPDLLVTIRFITRAAARVDDPSSGVARAIKNSRGIVNAHSISKAFRLSAASFHSNGFVKPRHS